VIDVQRGDARRSRRLRGSVVSPQCIAGSNKMPRSLRELTARARDRAIQDYSGKGSSERRGLRAPQTVGGTSMALNASRSGRAVALVR